MDGADDWNVLTTPDAPARTVVECLMDRIRSGALAADEVAGVLHPTTIANNAILERKGIRTAFVGKVLSAGRAKALTKLP